MPDSCTNVGRSRSPYERSSAVIDFQLFATWLRRLSRINCLRLAIHHDLAARRQEGKPSFDLAFEAPASLAGERAQLLVEAEFLALVSDEVEDGEHGLVGSTAQSAAELLQEDRGALGRPEE